jgi:hypothetical protein
MQPCLIPSLFMATKFLPDYLTEEVVCSCHPETTNSNIVYHLEHQTRLLEVPFHRHDLPLAIREILAYFYQAMTFAREYYCLYWTSWEVILFI